MQRGGQEEPGQPGEQARRREGRNGRGCCWDWRPDRTRRTSRPALCCRSRCWRARLGRGCDSNQSDRA